MKITVKEAARRAGVSPQALRVMIQQNIIDGAKCYGPKCRKTYYVTDEIMANFMKGGNNSEGR